MECAILVLFFHQTTFDKDQKIVSHDTIEALLYYLMGKYITYTSFKAHVFIDIFRQGQNETQ